MTQPTDTVVEEQPARDLRAGKALGPIGEVGRPQKREAFARLASVVVFFVIFGPIYGIWLGGAFLNSRALTFDVYQNVPVTIVAVGLVVCLAAGQFDLSVASMATLSVFLTVGLSVNQGLPLPLIIVIVLCVGAAGGLLNGFLVVRVRVNAFIATLATGGIFDGAAVIYSGGQQITQSPGHNLPSWFSGLHAFGSFQLTAPAWLAWIGLAVLVVCAGMTITEHWPPERRDLRFWTIVGVCAVAVVVGLVFAHHVMNVIPWEVMFLLLVVLVGWALMRYTAFGRGLYAIGGNPTAARLSGVPVARYTTLAFVITGVVASIAGIVLAANQGTAVPGLAAGYLLPAYAAAFLSTVIISDGRFHIWGTLVGGLAVVFIGQGLIIGGVPFTWNEAINGIVLGAAVAFATLLRGRDST